MGSESGHDGGASPVPSPCTRDCRLDPSRSVCLGCARTLDEIVDWPSMTDAQRRGVHARLREAAERRERA